MSTFDEKAKEIKQNWFIASLLEVRGLEGLNQKEFAKRIEVTDAFITRMKTGKTTVPASVIEKIQQEFSILPPQINQIDQSKVEEPGNFEYGNPTKWEELINSLRSNINDLRREVSETYDHIADLKEFNEYLKERELKHV